MEQARIACRRKHFSPKTEQSYVFWIRQYFTRFPGESIVIELPTGERIAVTVVRIEGDEVPPSTDAPKYMPMVWEELPEWLKYVA